MAKGVNGFQKGMTPWNKGKKMPQISGENHPMYGKHHTKKAIEKMKPTQFKKGQIPWNKDGGYYSPKTRGKMRRAKLGKTSLKKGKHYSSLWKKNRITKLDRICRRMREYLQWRSDVFERDKWTCKTCGKNGCYVIAHHIEGFSKIIKANKIKNIGDAVKCEELWDINNGVTLCEDCHKLTDNYGGREKKHREDK